LAALGRAAAHTQATSAATTELF